MFPLWFALLDGSFVFLDIGPSILFLVLPFFFFGGCFGLFMIGRVSWVRSLLSSLIKFQALQVDYEYITKYL